VAALIACWSTAALAQPSRPRLGDRCDVHFDPVVLSKPYNPMEPDDYLMSFSATVHRASLNVDLAYSALLLRHGELRLPIEVYVITDGGSGGGGDVVFERPGPPLEPGVDDAREIDFYFAGSLQADVQTAELQLRIPAGTAIDPGTFQAEFDVKYLCNYADGRSDRGNDNRGFRISFPVNTALQASLVGTEPDFGEIGTLSDTDVAAAGPSVNLRRHYLRVAATGPYEVMVVSQNSWRMTATGAPSGNAAERIAYRYELLDQQLDSGRPNFAPVICEASGVSGENIAMTATLTEGGLGKIPSPGYRDIVTITVTPLAATVGGAVRCD